MTRRIVFVLAACAALAACSASDSSPAPEPAPPPAAPPDAAQVELAPSGTYDPAGGRHLDEDLPPPVVRRPPPVAARALHPIDVTLRSTPPGAMAAVDGVQLGTTPVYWAGDANGRVHEFTFVLAHYSVARYRFVPITSGVLYAKLEAVAGEEPGPNLGPPIPLAVPGIAPPPPPTVITPPPVVHVAPPPPPPPPVDAAPPPVDAPPPPPPDDAEPAEDASPSTSLHNLGPAD